MIVLVDNEDRENEGDFVCAAERVTPEVINFMTRVGAGYLCLSLTGEDCDRLDLKPQAAQNNSLFGTPFTVSLDGHPRRGFGTGVSARDRANSIRLIIDPASTTDDFVRPGHINPLRARDGGVLVRTGQTEGSVDLCRLAGLHPSAVIIEVVREDGEMARRPDLDRICAAHGLKMCSVEQVIEYRLAREQLVHRIEPAAGSLISTPEGEFTLIAYHCAIDALPHLALTVGGVGVPGPDGSIPVIESPILTRVHRRDLLGDVFNERTHPSGRQLRTAMEMIQREGRGAIVYLRPEGHGEDLRSRIQRIHRPGPVSVNVPDLTRLDGVAARAQPMDNREFGIGGQILRDLGVRHLRLLTNTPRAMPGLSAFGLRIDEVVGIPDEGAEHAAPTSGISLPADVGQRRLAAGSDRSG